MTATDAGRGTWGTYWLQSLTAMFVGGLLGVAAIALMNRGVLTFEDYLPATLAATYVLLGVTVWINPNIRRTASPGEPLWPRSVLAMMWAVALIAPVIAPATVNPWMVFALIVICGALTWPINRLMERRLDELVKRVMVDTNQMAIRIIAPLMLLYGAAERLDLVQKGISIWVLNSIVLWLYLVLASVAWMRRGVGNPLVASEAGD